MLNLTGACGSLFLSPDLVLKRTVRAPGQEETTRFLEDHALNVVGFLLLLAMQGFAKHTSKDDMRSRAARYREVFEVVTKLVFGGTTMELGFDADVDPNDLEVCCRPNASESGSIIVENGRVSLYSDDCQDFLQLFRRIAKVSDEQESMTVAEFLGFVYKSKKGWPAIASQLFISAGMWFDALLHKLLTDDPFEAARAVDPARLSSDPQLADMLAMGELDGGDEAGVTNIPGVFLVSHHDTQSSLPRMGELPLVIPTAPHPLITPDISLEGPPSGPGSACQLIRSCPYFLQVRLLNDV